MKRIKKIEDIKCKNVYSDEEGNLINEETGNSLAWDILQIMGRSTRRMIVANIIQSIIIVALIVLLFIK